ncbi:hypothetical protein JW898_01355 [Candidatus Woesearchaeota archaeon]|nr:hypothetical protein [Candidatus Woesearchaeota archaeon]
MAAASCSAAAQQQPNACLQEYDDTGDAKPTLRLLVPQFRKTHKMR